MMRHLIFAFFLLFITSLACSAQFDSTKDGRYKEYSDSNVLLFTGKYKSGLRHGIFKEFDKEGLLLTKANYRRGQLRWLQLYKDGKMYAVINRKGEMRKVKDCGC